MNQYQLIALDMDGTLLNSKKQLSEGNRAALERAAAAGKQIALSTGRCRPELADYLAQIPGIRYLDCSSGALVYDLKEQKEICARRIQPELIEAFIRYALENDLMVHLLDQKSYVWSRQLHQMEYYGMGVYQSLFARICTPLDQILEDYLAHPFPVEKFNFYHPSLEARELTRKWIEQQQFPVTMAYSEISSLELTAAGVDKGSGLAKLCEHLGLSTEQSIAVGDADNDLPVLRTAGLSIAMGNAAEHVRKSADVCVSDCDHDGCAEAIDRYLLA